MRFPLRPNKSEVAAICGLPPFSPSSTMTTSTTNDNNMATTRNHKSGQIGNNNKNGDPDGQGRGQVAKLLTPGFVSPSQLVSDSKSKVSDKGTTTTHNNNSNASNSSSGGSITTTNCKNAVLAAVTKVVSSSDDEQEAFLAEIDSDLPNFLSRTYGENKSHKNLRFMGQDARFSFILFFTVFSFSLVLGLFVIQASYAWHNYQLLEMLGREDFSEEFFYLHYYDPPEPLTDESPSPGLRVNTSFYVH